MRLTLILALLTVALAEQAQDDWTQYMLARVKNAELLASFESSLSDYQRDLRVKLNSQSKIILQFEKKWYDECTKLGNDFSMNKDTARAECKSKVSK